MIFMFGIYGLNIEKNQDRLDIPRLVQYISPGKQQRINALQDRQEARRILLGDLLIRSIACRNLKVRNDEIQFQISRYGKPYLEGVDDYCFNLSHSGRWVIGAADRRPVGVDVEEIVPIELDVARHYFSAAEFAYISNQPESLRTAAFYDIWTLKESYIKALGCGLSKDLNSFTINITPDGKAVVSESPGEVFLRQYEIDEKYRLSVCAFNIDFPDRIEIVDVNWILEALQ